MNQEFKGFPDNGERIVYVRPVEVADLPEEIREQVGDERTIYAVHDSDGAQLALVRDRRLAYVLARQNDCAPVPIQ